jgi:hypothetical protein
MRVRGGGRKWWVGRRERVLVFKRLHSRSVGASGKEVIGRLEIQQGNDIHGLVDAV